jgi:hypothetical protein
LHGQSPPQLFDGQRGDDGGGPEPVVAAGRDLAHRLVVGFVKIVVYSIGVFSDYERWLASLSSGGPIRPRKTAP